MKLRSVEALEDIKLPERPKRYPPSAELFSNYVESIPLRKEMRRLKGSQQTDVERWTNEANQQRAKRRSALQRFKAVEPEPELAPNDYYIEQSPYGVLARPNDGRQY